MDKEFKQINQILPVSENQEENIQLSDILTDAEKRVTINHAIDQEKRKLARKMATYAGQDFINKFMDETDWMTKIDLEKVLKEANQRKHWAVEKENDRIRANQQEINERKLLEEKWDANLFFNVIKQYFIRLNRTPIKEGEFIFNESNDRLIKAVCYKFSNDPRYETELGFNFKNGLLISGDAGFGKTKTFEAIKNNPIMPISIYSMLDISEKVKDEGSCEINLRNMNLIDDAGSEQVIVNYYGTKINWFKNFIETYYHNNDDFSRLIITSNLGGEEWEQLYGYRVRSRLREKFDSITVTGPDKRGIFK